MGKQTAGLRRRAVNRDVTGAPKRKHNFCVHLGGLEGVTQQEGRRAWTPAAQLLAPRATGCESH